MPQPLQAGCAGPTPSTRFLPVIAAGVPLYGRVSDVWGVRRDFALSLPLFALGSLACALAPSLGLLVASRMLQGVGAAGIPAIATVAVAKLLPPGQRGAASRRSRSTSGAASTCPAACSSARPPASRSSG